MSSPEGFQPTIAARLAYLEAELSSSGSDAVEVALQGLPMDAYLGLEAGGVVILRIACDPVTVSADDTAAAVSIVAVPSGCRIRLQPYVQRHATSYFLEEVVSLLRQEHLPGDAGRAALQSWRELLASAPGAPLSDGALAGLHGELEVLEAVLAAGGSLADWTGWDRDQNDFRLPGLTIEVKATLSANYRRVHIHGLRQLADPEDGSRLVLVLRRLEHSPLGQSVPDLVDAVVRAGVSRADLLQHLSDVGYSEQHRAHYVSRKFVSQEVALREIDDGHPRLTPDLLDRVDLTAIDRVDYVLNLNGDGGVDLDIELEALIQQYMEES